MVEIKNMGTYTSSPEYQALNDTGVALPLKVSRQYYV
jgi:hypothetical protein